MIEAEESEPSIVIELDDVLDEEGIEKKDLVLDALQQIRTSDFTELKAIRVPTA